ncbi:hypothetical protein SAMN04487996_10398 [Dyadobacter soli]|uniref:Uncharacterized protein n=1 Tax=Dyadobacter soli TaxID=659014 RepID=A0A1G6ZGF6_9BACT|nr:hypothetical protein [Dyadobacter soli]SDE00935.1 hypothetical protein SAMN04487996_10398 [Dyadobacter soli]
MKLALPLKKRQSILNIFRFLNRHTKVQQEMDTTAYLMRSPANKARLLQAMKDIESGNHIFPRELNDL